MTTAMFIITSNNKMPQSLNLRHLVFSCTTFNTLLDWWQLTQGGSEVWWPCQSTIVGAACTEIYNSDRNFRTAWFEKGDFKIGIKKEKHWLHLYHYSLDVYTNFKHTFMLKQLVNFSSDDPFNKARKEQDLIINQFGTGVWMNEWMNDAFI